VVDQHPSTSDHRAAYDDAIATLLDSFSYERALHVFHPAGARCLQIGSGVFAGHLADLVGPDGHVTATQPYPARTFPNLTVIPQQAAIEPPRDSFDFIHARLVLALLPRRQQILARLIQALSPGGTILVEDWDTTRPDIVLHASSPQVICGYSRIQHALNQMAAAKGNDPTWARRLHASLISHHLTGVETIIHTSDWSGDGPGGQLLRAALAQHEQDLLRAGLTPDALAEARGFLDDPGFVPAGYLLYSTSGRRPEGDGTQRRGG
jgi:hypothetical protein